MDGVNRSVALAIFLVVVVIAGVAGYVFVRSQQSKVDALNGQLALLRERGKSNPSIFRPNRQFEKSQPSQASIEQRQRTASLQRLLKKKDELLKQQMVLLKRFSAEKDTLQKEIRSHLGLIVKLAEKQDGGEQVGQEVARLRTELSNSAAADAERASEVGTLQDRLEETEKELDELRAEAEALLAVAEAETEILRVSANSVILDAGESAVPALIKLLADDRPAVQIWAANGLESLGEAAAAAVASLTALLDDDNRQLQDAARSALRAIAR